MEIYIKLFEVLFPVFFIVGIGFFLGKKNRNLDTNFITNYSANFGAPALFIFAITSSGVKFDIFSEYFCITDTFNVLVKLFPAIHSCEKIIKFNNKVIHATFNL